MSGPFPPNCTLVFQVPLTDVTAVDGLGNPMAATTEVSVQCYLKKVSHQSREQSLDGADLSRVQVKGRCVEPTALPAGILPGAKAQATAGSLTGEFYLQAGIDMPAEWGIEAALGQKIEGYILSEVAWGEAL